MSRSFWREQRLRLLAAVSLMAILYACLFWSGVLGDGSTKVMPERKSCCPSKQDDGVASKGEDVNGKGGENKKSGQPASKTGTEKHEHESKTRTEEWTVPTRDRDGKSRNRVIAPR